MVFHQSLADLLDAHAAHRGEPFRGPTVEVRGTSLPAEYWSVLRQVGGFSTRGGQFRFFDVEAMCARNEGGCFDPYGERGRGFVAVAEDVFGDGYGYVSGREGSGLCKFLCEEGRIEPCEPAALEAFLCERVLEPSPDAFDVALARRAWAAGLRPGPDEHLALALPFHAGGAYVVENLVVESVGMHYGVLGQLVRAVGHLPDGAAIAGFDPGPEVASFWSWFGANVVPCLAGNSLPPDDVVRALDDAMAALGLAWELGPAPGGDEGWAFAVSFGASAHRMPRALAVASAAPPFAACRVLVGKPPKVWDGTLEIIDGMGPVRLSTSTWRCGVVRMADGYAIMVAPNEDADVDVEVLEQAAAIALGSVLGEHRYALRVRDVSVVEWDSLGALGTQTCSMSALRTVLR